jgi:ribosomal subunit interface protein
MQIPLQIAARNVDLSPAHTALIRRRAGKLESFYDRITACRVLVDAPQRREGRDFVVHVDLTFPGGELVVKHRPERELTAAIHQAFQAAERRLENYKERRAKKQLATGGAR